MPEDEKQRNGDLRSKVLGAAEYLRKRLETTRRQNPKAEAVCISQEVAADLIDTLKSVPSALTKERLLGVANRPETCGSKKTCANYKFTAPGDKCGRCDRIKPKI